MASVNPSASLEDRLDLVSKMLEEAVALLRSTMVEVREEVEEEERGRDVGQRQLRPDQWPR
jgi:hypothetical protein